MKEKRQASGLSPKSNGDLLVRRGKQQGSKDSGKFLNEIGSSGLVRVRIKKRILLQKRIGVRRDRRMMGWLASRYAALGPKVLGLCTSVTKRQLLKRQPFDKQFMIG